MGKISSYDSNKYLRDQNLRKNNFQRNFSITFGSKVQNMNTNTFLKLVLEKKMFCFKMATKVLWHCAIMLILPISVKMTQFIEFFHQIMKINFKQLQKKWNEMKKKIYSFQQKAALVNPHALLNVKHLKVLKVMFWVSYIILKYEF